ncbi:hypothetical protein ACJ41O_010679 [Fusarium nematophilum]
MPVTEFAILQLKSGYDESKFREVLKHSQEVQAQWSREHQPQVLQGKPYSIPSNSFIRKSDPPYLLITAPWDTPEGHAEWIESDENKGLMGSLLEYIAQVPDAVVLFHLSPAGSQDDLRGDLFAREALKVVRVSVKPDQKEKLQEEYRLIESSVGSAESGGRVWGGWRIEKTNDLEELVVFWSQSLKDDVGSRLSQVQGSDVSGYEFQPLL